jgi:hypothetical protein
MSLYKLPPSAIIYSFSESYAVMLNHLPLPSSAIPLLVQGYVGDVAVARPIRLLPTFPASSASYHMYHVPFS